MYVSIRLRKEWHQALKELCNATGVKLSDSLKLWPKCPRCGALLAEVGGTVTCAKCRAAYRLWTPQ